MSLMRLHSQIRRIRPGEQGYVLLLLLLMVAMMVIAAGIIVPSITFEIKRDREQEMIHRGVQYSRAIRAYYKKFGRYPAKLEDLENTNQLRFLRKRYKDPITGKDFKLLHYGEAKLSLNGIAGGTIAGATPVSNLSSSGGLGQSSSFGQTSSFGGNSSFGNNSNSLLGQNSQSAGNPTTGTNPSQTGTSPTDATGSNASDSNNGTGDSGSGTSASNTQFGGAPIVGVASTSKDTTIREYDHKKKYNQWQFVYDPTFDQGFLITTPYQPSIQMLGQQQNLNGQNNSGQNGQNGQNGNTSGFSNSFGNSSGNSFGNSFGSSGTQNSPSSPGGGGYNNTNQPQNPPPQSPPQQQ
jgi:type II secretory pathway pseudopilin PulG